MAITNTRSAKKIQSLATEIAMNSPCVHKHGSVITRGSNKILACGCNNNMRSEFLESTIFACMFKWQPP